MASFMRCMFFSEISPTVKASCPKRIGTRMISLLLNLTSLLYSKIFVISNRIALEPISMAAYFFIFMIILPLIDFHNICTFQIGRETFHHLGYGSDWTNFVRGYAP